MGFFVFFASHIRSIEKETFGISEVTPVTGSRRKRFPDVI